MQIHVYVSWNKFKEKGKRNMLVAQVKTTLKHVNKLNDVIYFHQEHLH